MRLSALERGGRALPCELGRRRKPPAGGRQQRRAAASARAAARAHRMELRASDTQRSALGSTTSGKRMTLKRESMVKAVCGRW